MPTLTGAGVHGMNWMSDHSELVWTLAAALLVLGVALIWWGRRS